MTVTTYDSGKLENIETKLDTINTTLGGVGSGTQYTEDAAAASNPVGTVPILVRRDTLTVAEVSADGDNVAQKGTSKGQAHVKASDTDTLIGEVQASPTANTVLDRLKSLLTGIVLAAGTNLVGRAVADASSATGGIASTYRLLSAAGTSGDAANVKASAGRLYAIQGYNAASSVRYLKLYNSASAPTAGSGTPVKTLALPPTAAFAFDWPLGYTFATGIGFTLVTGSADNSSSSVTAADIVGLNIDYV